MPELNLNNIKNLLIRDLDIDNRTKMILEQANYQTVGELIAHTEEEIAPLFENSWLNNLERVKLLRNLKIILHYKLKVTFACEFDDLGLTPEKALYSVENFPLSKSIIIILRKLGIYTLGDLLRTDYEILAKAWNMGEKKLQDLKDYIHSLGYTLKGEKLNLEEIKNSIKAQGGKLLEEIIDESKIYLTLYRNGIYTLEDLLNYGSEVYNIKGFGPTRQKLLKQKLKELNIVLADKKVDYNIPASSTLTMSPEWVIEQAKKENAFIRKCLERKKKLLLEYESLIEEKEALITREAELDELIKAKLEQMKEVISYER